MPTFVSTSDYAHVLPDLNFRREIEASDPGEGDDLYSISLRATWVDKYASYDVTSLTIEQRLEPVTTEGLRTIAVQTLFRQAAEVLAVTDAGEDLQVPPTEDLIALTTRDEPLRLLWAARIYVLARAQNDPPLARVARAFRCSQSTATRIVKRSREAGLI